MRRQISATDDTSGSSNTPDLNKKKSLPFSIRSLFTKNSGRSTPTTATTTREGSLEAEPSHSPATTPATTQTDDAPRTTAVYPESHGKFQEERVRSQPQEAHSYSLDQKKGKHESRFHLHRKASLAWMALKTKAKIYKTEAKLATVV